MAKNILVGKNNPCADENNKIMDICGKVQIKGHAKEVLKACQTVIKEDNA